MPDNTITIVGNLTDDPELRFTSNGDPWVTFTVAVNGRKKVGDDWEDKLEGFFRCSAWRGMAENIAESFGKGTRVILTGKLQQRSWEDDEGNKKYAIEIVTDDIGPSMKWATAQVERKTSGGGGGGAWKKDEPPASAYDDGTF